MSFVARNSAQLHVELAHAIDARDIGRVRRTVVALGAEANREDVLGATHFARAVGLGAHDVAAAIVECAAPVCDFGRRVDKESHMHAIARSRHSSSGVLLSMLIARGADVNATNIFRQTPLMYAIQVSVADVVARLLLCGAHVSPLFAAPDVRRDANVLVLAASSRNSAVVSYLLASGFPPQALDDRGRSAESYCPYGMRTSRIFRMWSRGRHVAQRTQRAAWHALLAHPMRVSRSAARACADRIAADAVTAAATLA